MTQEEIQSVLDVCAQRLETRAQEFENTDSSDSDDLVAYVLRCEAMVIRAGCHKYRELICPR